MGAQEAKWVVIVDDDHGVREALRFLFETHGFPVRCYASGHDLIEGQGGDYATVGCVVIDNHMLGPTGMTTIRRLRAQAIQVPFIVITAAPDKALRKQAAEHGVLAVLEKPLADDALIRLVRGALNPSSGGQ